jgi:glycosyltransferase involved in cell wall biosynthesis
VKGALGLTPEQLPSFGDAVEYAGAPADPEALLASCHLFVYPSHAEGMPQPVLEAMAAGRPVITTDVAGCRDTVDERVNGCLVQAGDAKALAAAMESFLKRPDLIPPIARASRAKAERFCAQDTVNRSMLAALGLE